MKDLRLLGWSMIRTFFPFLEFHSRKSRVAGTRTQHAFAIISIRYHASTVESCDRSYLRHCIHYIYNNNALKLMFQWPRRYAIVLWQNVGQPITSDLGLFYCRERKSQSVPNDCTRIKRVLQNKRYEKYANIPSTNANDPLYTHSNAYKRQDRISSA